MKKILLTILFLNFISAAHAVKMVSIYTGEAPVSSQSEEDRGQATQQAFSQALIKVSGNSAILQNPVVKAALPQASNYVEELGYSPSAQTAKPFLLKVTFDPSAMENLLVQAKAPAWGENRPLILVWMVIENPGHAPELVDSASTQEFATLLVSRAQYRGVPLLLPMMDMTDLEMAHAADAVAMLDGPMQKAAERYHADGVLLGDIQWSGKTSQSHWKLAMGKDHWEWQVDGDNAPLVVESLIDKMAVVLSGRYAAQPAEKEICSLMMTVTGISGQDDLENVMRFLKRFSTIKKMEIENVSGTDVIFNLMVQGTKQAFMQDVEVGKHLSLQAEKENNLTYIWMR